MRVVRALRVPIAILIAALATPAIAGVTVDPLLAQQIAATPLAAGAVPVVITYDHAVSSSDLAALRALGITGGVQLSPLPMVLTRATGGQIAALRATSGVRSLYANRRFPLLSNESRTFIGQRAVRQDAQVTQALGGLPVSGQGIGVAYVDTGIDATHPDLALGKSVVQNVFFPLAEYSATEMPLPSDFIPIVAIENAPISDVEGGHGTFGAGVTAGSGEASGGLYGGVAPGAQLVGLTAGNDVGLTTFAILQAYGYTLANQFRYNIRVCNNSWGTVLADYPYDPNDPINVATRALHDSNIVVVFAAGNGIDSVGDVPGAINPFSVAPWVISVAAGEKRGLGTPAVFSSRGEDDGTGTDVAGMPADPAAPPNLRPDIIGSGVDIKSARSKAPGVTNVAGSLPIFVGANDLTTIPPAYLPYYTTSQGTSFSTPQVSGVVALMLQANPLLNPDEVVTLLRSTANPMPYPERVVGAGYVDAHNAVRAALGLSAVPHPADLFPHDQPEILDAPDDQLGTTAQDILSGDFAFDADAEQLVYTLTLADLSSRTPNSRWTMSSKFGTVTVFVTAALNEQSVVSYSYGRIVPLATGTPSQETLGPADGGQIVGNQVVVRLAVAKISAAAGFDVLYTTSTSTEAKAQILIGSTLSPRNLLFNADSASGSEFELGERPQPAVTVSGPSPVVTSEAGATAAFNVGVASRPAAPVVVRVLSSRLDEGRAVPDTLTFDASNWRLPQTVEVQGRDDMSKDGDAAYTLTLDPSGSGDAEYASLAPLVVQALNLDDETGEDPPESGKFTERYTGTLVPGAGVLEVPFDLRRTSVSATLHLSPRTSATFTLVDGAGHVIDQSTRGKVQGRNLVPGRYVYRIAASVAQPTDVALTSVQSR